jgi:hypothetical protein
VKRLVVALAALAAGGVAHAEPPRGTYIHVDGAAPLAPGPSSSLIYLHRCLAVGCPITAGAADDSRTQTSQIAMGNRTIGPFTQGDMVWADLVACVKATYAPFAVTVTDVDPGNVPHFENVVGGTPDQLRGDITGAGGVAPFTCNEVPNGISFTFDVYGPDAQQLCWTVAQETAHTFGLEHEFLQGDPMTYLGGSLPKRFQWQQAECGEFHTRPCACPRTLQSSYQMIQTIFGVGTPNPPTVAIVSPSGGKTVQPHFTVHATAADDAAIDHVELWIDGAMVASQLAATTATTPYVFVAPDLPQGSHALEVRAIAVTMLQTVADVSVDLGPPCTADRGCTGSDVCVMGVCVPGPTVSGGLGGQCDTSSNCIDGLCAGEGSGQLMYCVEPCDPGTKKSCPHGFSCLSASNGGGVCFASGGCCDAGGGASGSMLLAGAVAIALRRRSRARASSRSC